MSKANQIVSSLLEDDTPSDAPADPADVDVDYHIGQFGKDVEDGKVTGYSRENTFWHRTEKKADGSAITVRRMGKTKLWATRPGEFRIPVKYGMYNSFYITPENAAEWTTKPVADGPRPQKVKRTMRVINNPYTTT